LGIKVASVEIKSYRSVPNQLHLDLATGPNTLIGPNNVGKSNVVRALGLAFGEGAEAFDLERDVPASKSWGRPTVTLELVVVPRVRSVERTLLRYAEEVEQNVFADRGDGAKHTSYASQKRLRFRVQYSQTGRSEYLVTRGAGNQRATPELNDRAIQQLRSCLRFVLIKSGEDVDAFLKGRFGEVLANVLEENFSEKLAEARNTREDYIKDLEETLFGPLGDQVRREMCELVPELRDVELRPQVPSIEQTIGNADVRLTDVAETDLEGKGTGLRGGLLVAMLKYLSEESRRSLVLAVEEPESFLHPTAQEMIREDLEQVGQRSDVTLLMTTHSPFVVPRGPETRMFSMAKSGAGETTVTRMTHGSEPRADAIAGLFPGKALPALIDEVASLEADGCRAILVVEGESDRTFLETAARLEGRLDLLDGVKIHPASGAKQAGVAAVVWRSRAVAPVVVLLDDDAHGRSTRDRLIGGFQFAKGHVLTYRAGFDAEGCEAEWLIAESLFERFFRDHGEQFMDQKQRAGNGRAQRWVYGLHHTGKEAFSRFVATEARVGELSPFVALLEKVAERATAR
jgi:predicted ATPase